MPGLPASVSRARPGTPASRSEQKRVGRKHRPAHFIPSGVSVAGERRRSHRLAATAACAQLASAPRGSARLPGDCEPAWWVAAVARSISEVLRPQSEHGYALLVGDVRGADGRGEADRARVVADDRSRDRVVAAVGAATAAGVAVDGGDAGVLVVGRVDVVGGRVGGDVFGSEAGRGGGGRLAAAAGVAAVAGGAVDDGGGAGELAVGEVRGVDRVGGLDDGDPDRVGVGGAGRRERDGRGGGAAAAGVGGVAGGAVDDVDRLADERDARARRWWRRWCWSIG